MGFFEFILVFLSIFVLFSPLFLFFMLLNIDYEILEDRLNFKFYKWKLRTIMYSNIKNIKPFKQFPSIKYEKFPFNNAIMIDLYKAPILNFSQIVIAPKNRDEVANILGEKINAYKLKQ